ncbi:hypothetical protein D9M69_606590 [compost metagenome]
MPARGVASSTPGSACSSGTRVSRQRRRWATRAGVTASPCAMAATAPRCTNTGAHEVLNSISLPRAGVSAAGSTSQPRRQPVMRKLLEKLWATMTRSSGAATSRKLLAAPLAVSPA